MDSNFTRRVANYPYHQLKKGATGTRINRPKEADDITLVCYEKQL
jgi:hypothetical protein